MARAKSSPRVFYSMGCHSMGKNPSTSQNVILSVAKDLFWGPAEILRYAQDDVGKVGEEGIVP